VSYIDWNRLRRGAIIVGPASDDRFRVLDVKKKSIVAIDIVLYEVYRWSLHDDGWRVAVRVTCDPADSHWMMLAINSYPPPAHATGASDCPEPMIDIRWRP